MNKSFSSIILAILLALPAPARAGWFSNVFSPSKTKILSCLAAGVAVAGFAYWKISLAKEIRRQQAQKQAQEEVEEINAQAFQRRKLNDDLKACQKLTEEISKELPALVADKAAEITLDNEDPRKLEDGYQVMFKLKNHQVVGRGLPPAILSIIYLYARGPHLSRFIKTDGTITCHTVIKVKNYGVFSDHASRFQMQNVLVDGTVHRNVLGDYNLHTGKLLQYLPVVLRDFDFNRQAGFVMLDPDGSRNVIAIDEKNSYKLTSCDYYEPSGKKNIWQSSKSLTCLNQESRHKNIFCAGANDGTIFFLTKSKPIRLLHSLEAHTGPVTYIYLDSDTKLVTASEDKTLKVWDIGPGFEEAVKEQIAKEMQTQST